MKNEMENKETFSIAELAEIIKTQTEAEMKKPSSKVIFLGTEEQLRHTLDLCTKLEMKHMKKTITNQGIIDAINNNKVESISMEFTNGVKLTFPSDSLESYETILNAIKTDLMNHGNDQ